MNEDARAAGGVAAHGDLFRHVSAEKAAHYRAIMEAFAAAKRQFRLHLRPDEVHAQARWPAGERPAVETVQAALAQLEEWGNLVAQPDTARVSTIEDFYRARFLYRLSEGGEAVESALETFQRALDRRAELQSVALEDILSRLEALTRLAAERPLDAAKLHEALRDLTGVFADLADNAQAFMAGIARSLELQRAEAQAVMAYKARLIDYLERFIGDLVSRSGPIARHLRRLSARAPELLAVVAAREARDAAPEESRAREAALAERLIAWRERWAGLERWFLSDGHAPSQSDLLRSRARAAIPQLLTAIAALNERRAGRSDRSADYRALARWFAETEAEPDAHRLARVAFALHPARHLALLTTDEAPSATTPWAEGPAAQVHPRLRERGQLTPRGARPRVRDRSRDRALLAEHLGAERARLRAVRERLATGAPVRLSALARTLEAARNLVPGPAHAPVAGAAGPHLDADELAALLGLLGEALADQASPDAPVERVSADGSLHIRLEPLAAGTRARIESELGCLSGRDHLLTVSLVGLVP